MNDKTTALIGGWTLRLIILAAGTSLAWWLDLWHLLQPYYEYVTLGPEG